MPRLVLQVRKINISLSLNELRKTFICSECLEKIDSSLHKAVSQGEDKKKKFILCISSWLSALAFQDDRKKQTLGFPTKQSLQCGPIWVTQ